MTEHHTFCSLQKVADELCLFLLNLPNGFSLVIVSFCWNFWILYWRWRNQEGVTEMRDIYVPTEDTCTERETDFKITILRDQPAWCGRLDRSACFAQLAYPRSTIAKITTLNKLTVSIARNTCPLPAKNFSFKTWPLNAVFFLTNQIAKSGHARQY